MSLKDRKNASVCSPLVSSLQPIMPKKTTTLCRANCVLYKKQTAVSFPDVPGSGVRPRGFRHEARFSSEAVPNRDTHSSSYEWTMESTNANKQNLSKGL